MSSKVESSIKIGEKQNDFEYSISKILVAVLLFLFLCQTTFMFYKGNKYKKAIIELHDKQKKHEKNIAFLTEKYNLVEEDLKRLEKERYAEQEAFKNFKDSVRNGRRQR